MLKLIKNCSGKCSFLFSLIFSLLFISCFNSLTPNPEDSQSQTTDSSVPFVSTPAIANLSPAARYVNISGHFTTAGALPETIAASLFPPKTEQIEEDIKASEGLVTLNTYYSAFPVPESTNNDVIYYAIATDVNGVEQAVEGTVNADARTYEIKHLKIGVRWIIEVGIKVKNTVDGEDVWIRCLYDVAEPKTFTESDFTINKIFFLQPDTSGTGFVDLDMTVDSSINAFAVYLEDSEKRTVWENACNADSTKVISKNKIKLGGLPAGSYELTLKFYTASSTSGYPDFTSIQSINVVSGMTTETWCSDGTALITGSGISTVFDLTSALINEYKNSLIYVGQNIAATSVEVTALDTNEGTAYAPLATLQEAINRIESNNNPMDYRILVSGTVSGAASGDAEINSSINGKALSITIDKTGNTHDAAPVINGSGSNSVLYIETEVPVKIRNVTITGGNTSSSGGGLYIGEDAEVTLVNCVVTGNQTTGAGNGGGIFNVGELKLHNTTVSNNQSVYGGAGIYNDKNLTITGNSEISGNESGFIEGQYVYSFAGGGIYNAGGSNCCIKGGTIKENKSKTYGAGIYNAGYLELSGGEISANTFTDTGDIGSGGAAVFSHGTFEMNGGTIKDHRQLSLNGNPQYYSGVVTISTASNGTGGIFTMTGGSITGNRANGLNAGVYLMNSTGDPFFTMTGGEISDNEVFTDSVFSGGAVFVGDGTFKISGSAYIPYGGEHCKNDIYLPTGKKITAAGNLSRHSSTNKLAIFVNTWTRGAAAIEADGAGITNLTSYLNFVTSNAVDWEPKLSADNSKIYLNSPIYVAGSSVHPTCGVAGSSSGNGSRSAPFDSIENACSIMDNSSLDYKIYIDGTIPAGQVIGSGFTGAAHSITITGANDLADDGTPEDKIEGPNKIEGSTGIGFTLNTTTAPVTLKKLLITGCELSSGSAAGVYVTSGTLSLGDDLVITGNKAGGTGGKGAGVSINTGASSVLNISGNVKIYGNTDCSTPANPCNVYLPGSTPSDTKKINVTGPLTKGSDKANIYVSVSTDSSPDLTSSVTFTNGYGFGTGGHNAGVVPATYFHCDNWAVRASAAGEAELAASGGSISIDPIYEDITISLDKYLILKSDTSKAFSFSAKGKNANGTNKALTIGNGEGKVHLTYSLSYHGENVPSDGGYYTTGTNTFTLASSLPAGDYILSATAVYNGKTYSASFPVQFKEFLGSKSKTQERAVGDIIFNDGSAMPYSEYAALDDSIKNSGLRNKAIAVIYYKGTDLNNDGDTTTVRTLGVGLKQWGECFCNAMAKAFNENITTIQCGVSGSAWNYNFTGDKKGSDNFDQIAAFFEANNITEPNFSSYYSAFNRASNYHEGRLTSENSSRISWDSEYATGWYFPTIAELFWIYKNCKIEGESKVFDIDTVMEALGGDKFETNTYLSSSQHSSTARNIYTLTSYNISSIEKNDARKKTCYIREF